MASANIKQILIWFKGGGQIFGRKPRIHQNPSQPNIFTKKCPAFASDQRFVSISMVIDTLLYVDIRKCVNLWEWNAENQGIF